MSSVLEAFKLRPRVPVAERVFPHAPRPPTLDRHLPFEDPITGRQQHQLCFVSTIGNLKGRCYQLGEGERHVIWTAGPFSFCILCILYIPSSKLLTGSTGLTG